MCPKLADQGPREETPRPTGPHGGRFRRAPACQPDPAGRDPGRRRGPGPVQPVPTKAALRYWLTAASGTRKERPTRIASSSPEWTRRYTVIFDTRMIVATSATVKNLTSLRGVSLAIS